MDKGLEKFLHWSPRVFCILFAGFLGLFALDVFSQGLGPWGTAAALVMHLVPSLIVLAVLAVSWRREWVGALGFPALAAVHLARGWGSLHWNALAAVSGPLFLVGALFTAAWALRAHRTDR